MILTNLKQIKKIASMIKLRILLTKFLKSNKKRLVILKKNKKAVTKIYLNNKKTKILFKKKIRMKT